MRGSPRRRIASERVYPIRNTRVRGVHGSRPTCHRKRRQKTKVTTLRAARRKRRSRNRVAGPGPRVRKDRRQSTSIERHVERGMAEGLLHQRTVRAARCQRQSGNRVRRAESAAGHGLPLLQPEPGVAVSRAVEGLAGAAGLRPLFRARESRRSIEVLCPPAWWPRQRGVRLGIGSFASSANENTRPPVVPESTATYCLPSSS